MPHVKRGYGLAWAQKQRREEIEAYILEQQMAGMMPTGQEIADRFDVSRVLVATIRGRMVKEGRLPRPPRAAGALEETQRKARKMMEKLESIGTGVPMTVEERRSFLSDLARVEPRADVKVQALSALDRLEGRLGTMQVVGHGAPLSREEAWGRVEAVNEAYRRLFGKD